MEKKYPFKFLDSYNQNDTDIFFGRDEEIEALYEMVFQNSVLLVYGASGTGKTSLIQCGLAGKFKSYDWLALTIRRGTNINESLEKALIAAGGDEIDEEESRTNDGSKKLTGLLRLIKGVYLNSFKPIYLIFDQFEELYILGKKEEQEKFIDAVKEMLKAEQPVKMIFSIREEYLGHLFEFEKQVPQLLRKKLRVEPMTLNKVADVIKGINSSARSNVRIKETEVDAITQGIFERLRGKKKTLTIQLPYLQVFLDKLYLETTKDETRKADALIELSVLNRIGDIGDVLRNFLEEQVAGISKKLSLDNRNVNPETVWKILSPFSTLEGTKEPISKKELGERLKEIDPKLIDEAVESFVNSRIVNYSESTNLYELAHDSLALRIAQKRSDEDISLLEVRRLIKNQVSLKQDAREVFSRKQLNFIEPYLHKLNLTKEEETLVKESKEAEHKAEKRRRARRRSIVISIAGVTILVIAGLSYFLIQQNIAKNENIELLSNNYWNNSKSKKAESDYVYALANAAMAFSTSKDKDLKENILTEIESKWPVVNLKHILTAKSQIVSAAFINDGKQIITLDKNHAFTIWNALTGDSIGSKSGLPLNEKGQKLASDLSPDGRHVLVNSGDGKLQQWSTSGSKMVDLEITPAMISTQFSRDGNKYFTISYSDNFATCILNLYESNKKLVFSVALSNTQTVTRWDELPIASFSADGKYIVVKYDNNKIIVINTASGKKYNLDLKVQKHESDEVSGFNLYESDYKSPIKIISFDNEGKAILTANSDNTVRLWDAATGLQKGDSMKCDRPVERVYFSPDCSLILAIDEDNSTFVWDTKTTTKLGPAFKLEPGSSSPVFSPDGKNILTVVNGTVSIWQLLERKDENNDDLSNTSYYDYDFSKKRFYSPDLKKMVIKKIKNGFLRYRILDTETRKLIGREITSKHKSRGIIAEPVIFSPDSKRLITRYNKDSIQLWNADSGTPIGEMIPLHISWNPVFSHVRKGITDNNKKPGLKKLMTMQDIDTAVEFQLWDIEVGKKIGPKIIKSRIYSQSTEDNSSFYRYAPPVFSADGNWVYISFSIKDSLYYELFDATTGKQKGPGHSLRLPANRDFSPYPVISPDGTSIFAMINDSTFHLLDAESGKQKGDVFRYHPNWSPLYSPGGKWLLICTSDSTAQFIDVETRQKRGNPIISLRSDVLANKPLINSDGSRVLTIGNAGMVHLWNTQTHQQIKDGIKHESDHMLPVFSPDGKIFLTFDYFGTARLYDAATGEQRGPALKHPKSNIQGVLFSQDGNKILITYSPDNEFDESRFTGIIWNAVTGRQIGQEIKDIFGEENFSEDGKWLLYSNYYSDQLLNTKGGDLDIPADLLELQVLMSSGYKYDFSIDEKSIITSKEFYGKDGLRENYYSKAVAHYKVCKFSKYNLWRRFNEEEARKIRPDDFNEENTKDTSDSEFQILTAFNVSDTSRANNGSYLEPGQAIYSKNKEYLLAYREDGNLVIYRKNGMQSIWESFTSGYPAYRTVMQYDGNLVIYADDPGKTLGNNAIWSSNTWENNAGATLVLEDDGRLVIYNKKNKPVWDSKSGRKLNH